MSEVLPRVSPCRPEDELLLACARRAVGSVEGGVEGHGFDTIDWEYVERKGEEHGVTSLLAETLRDCAAVPVETMQRTERRAKAYAARNLLLGVELTRLCEVFDARGIRALPYKGLTVPASAYGKLGARRTADLDLLVAPPQYQAAQRTLVDEGYEQQSSYGWESCFYHEARAVPVDLHRGLSPARFRVEVDFDDVWKRAERVSAPPLSVKAPCPADHIVILAIQIARDSWEQKLILAKLVDLARCARGHSALPWTDVREASSRLHLERILTFSCGLADAVVGLTSEGRSAFAAGLPDVSCETEQVVARLFGERPVEENARRVRIRLHNRLRERLRDRLYPYYRSVLVDSARAAAKAVIKLFGQRPGR